MKMPKSTHNLDFWGAKLELIVYSRKSAFPFHLAINRFEVTGIIEIILLQPSLTLDIDIVDYEKFLVDVRGLEEFHP